MVLSTESNKTSPVILRGGSGTVFKVTCEMKASVPSAPTNKWANISKG